MYNGNSRIKVSLVFIVLIIPLSLVCFNALKVVPFIDSMNTSINFQGDISMQRGDWQVIKALYDQFVVHYQDYYQEQPRIPKIIHQVWLGSPLPERYKAWQKSWQNAHPDWQYILWTDKEVQKFGLTNHEIYNASRNYGERSDIVRIEVLYRLGGLYVDTDFECLQPFDTFHHCFNFYTAVGYSSEVQLWNGLIASVPGHPILKRYIDTMGKTPASNAYEVFNTTGAFLYTRCFFEVIAQNSGPIALLPVTYVYPWPNYLCAEKDGRKYIRPESYGIHHWHRSWLK